MPPTLLKSPLERLALSAGFALVMLFAGCASVDPAPFAEFSASLQPLRAAIDTQAAVAADASRQDLVDRIARDEISPADLQLDFDDTRPFTSTYGFLEVEPMLFKLLRFRQGLALLNDSLIAYAQSLLVLAGAGEGGDIIPTKDQFDQIARDLNADAGSAAAALGVSLDSGDSALLSAAAVTLFKTYIESERRGELSAAITEVQPRIDEFSSGAQQAANLLAQLVKKNYSETIPGLIRAAPPDAMAILALNDKTQATLATLKSLSGSYAAIPAAHRDLSKAASNAQGTLAGLTALANETTRLQGLVKKLAEANAMKATSH